MRWWWARIRYDGPSIATTTPRCSKRSKRPAVFDRLTFAGQIIETGTTSYRLAHARQRRAAG